MVDEYKKNIETLIKETDDVSFQIKDLRRKNRDLTAENDKNIDSLQAKLMGIEHQIKEALENSKEDAIKVKCGWTHFRVMKDLLVFTEGTIDEIKRKYPDSVDRYIKKEESLKKNNIKKDLDEGIITLEEMSKVPQEKKFEYKYTED